MKYFIKENEFMLVSTALESVVAWKRLVVLFEDRRNIGFFPRIRTLND